jgi:predicted Zn-dependent protease
MIGHKTFIAALRFVLSAALIASLAARPAMAQSVLRDSETESFLHEIAAPLAKAAGLDPKAVEVVLIDDKSINAFAATGETVYLNSGLVLAADDVSEVQGVIAHELGHVTGGHVFRMSDGLNGPA